MLSSGEIALAKNKTRRRLMHIERDCVLISFDRSVIVACESIHKRKRNKGDLRSRIEVHRVLSQL